MKGKSQFIFNVHKVKTKQNKFIHILHEKNKIKRFILQRKNVNKNQIKVMKKRYYVYVKLYITKLQVFKSTFVDGIFIKISSCKIFSFLILKVYYVK